MSSDRNMCSNGDTLTSWQTLATAKREAILGSIPEEWRLAKIPTVEEQRNVTGAYIRQFLSAKEVEITETDAMGIVEKTTSGAWRAVEVIQAFCHRASLSHQLVRTSAGNHHGLAKTVPLTLLIRSIAFTRRSSMPRWQMPRSSTHTLLIMANPKAPCTACP